MRSNRGMHPPEAGFLFRRHNAAVQEGLPPLRCVVSHHLAPPRPADSHSHGPPHLKPGSANSRSSAPHRHREHRPTDSPLSAQTGFRTGGAGHRHACSPDQWRHDSLWRIGKCISAHAPRLVRLNRRSKKLIESITLRV
jgi:hypothetical protein